MLTLWDESHILEIMTTTQDQFLSEVDRYLTAKGMAETTFGRRAVNDGKFLGRLRAGGTVTTRTIDRARAWMTANPPTATANRSAAA